MSAKEPWQIETLVALVDTVVPADGWPGGWLGGVESLLRDNSDGFMEWANPIIESCCSIIDENSVLRFGRSFDKLSVFEREVLFGDLLSAEDSESGEFRPFNNLIDIVFQGFYAGTSQPAGWEMVGYSTVHDAGDAKESLISGIERSDVKDHYDTVVVGAGAAGGVVATELSERGLRVLLVERSIPMPDSSLRNNHLQGKRAGLYDVTVGPGKGNPRLIRGRDGRMRKLDGDSNALDYGLVAMTLGGGTRIWQGMAWRFWKQDFNMASTYGTPDDSTLSDWPIDEVDLAPYYDRVEWELGVSGDPKSVVALSTARSKEFPMPALPGGKSRILFSTAAEKAKLKVSPIPYAINSVERASRKSCVSCYQCVGDSCPVDAKNGTHNTFIPRGLSTGRLDLLMGSQVVQINQAKCGVATSIKIRPTAESADEEIEVSFDSIFVASGAVETPRLLLASQLGNKWVGKNHHSHGIALAIAIVDKDYSADTGPGHTSASVDFVHSDATKWGGGVMFDTTKQSPYERAQVAKLASGSKFGLAHKQWMRGNNKVLGVVSMVQEIPSLDSRVEITHDVLDNNGMPAAVLVGAHTTATKEAVDFMAENCAKWLEATGLASKIITIKEYNSPQGSEHSAGTARMSDDPSHGACDSHGLLFGTTNVYVADASAMPTNGGFNPGLTVMANALRIADKYLKSRGL